MTRFYLSLFVNPGKIQCMGPSSSAFTEKKNSKTSLATSHLGLRNKYVQIECQLGYIMMFI